MQEMAILRKLIDKHYQKGNPNNIQDINRYQSKEYKQ
jgi:hypothetical protein